MGRTHSPADALPAGGWLVVDEAGMVSQDAARALVTTAIAHGWQVRVQGDSFQFGAVGVGGVMEIAKQAADPGRVWLLDDANDVHRFRLRTGETDEAYAAHSVALRTGADPEQAAATVMEHAQVYGSDAERAAVIAASWAGRAHAGTGLVIAGTNEQVQLLNGLIRDQLVAAGTIGRGRAITTTPVWRAGGSRRRSAPGTWSLPASTRPGPTAAGTPTGNAGASATSTPTGECGWSASTAPGRCSWTRRRPGNMCNWPMR